MLRTNRLKKKLRAGDLAADLTADIWLLADGAKRALDEGRSKVDT